VLRQHCEAVGRDYGQIEKTTMLIMDPSTTSADVVRAAGGARELGFTAAYIAAKDITEPARIIDVLASALPELR
jgi:alkanesulfonate monooxygenase